jgi:hypothetical protein
MFQDREKLGAKYVLGDILEPNEQMKELEGRMDFINATHLLHNWNWMIQVHASCNLSTFSKTGTIILGYQVGTPDLEMAKGNKQGEEEGAKLHTPRNFPGYVERGGREDRDKVGV